MEAIEMDRRRQLVLDCLDCEQPPFGKGTLVRFRALLMSKSFDRRLIEKTIEMAQKQEPYNSRSFVMKWRKVQLHPSFSPRFQSLSHLYSLIFEQTHSSQVLSGKRLSVSIRAQKSS